MPSTAIHDIAYDADSETLTVTFITSGRRYRYYGVDIETYDGLRRSLSKGLFFNRTIKPNHDYELLFDPDWGARPGRVSLSGPTSATMPKTYTRTVTPE